MTAPKNEVRRWDFAGKNRGDWFECEDGRWVSYAEYSMSLAREAKLLEALNWFEINSYDKRDSAKAREFREAIAEHEKVTK